MAETIVSFALQKLLQFVTTEMDLVGSLPGEVRSISAELQSIKAVMKDAEKQAEDDDSIKEWVKQVRVVSYQIEDVLDDYFLLKQQQQNHPLPHVQEEMPTCFDAKKLLAKVARCFTQVIPKHELAVTIKTIKEEISEISSRRQRYAFITTERVNSDNNISLRGIRSLYEDDSELVGIEGPKAEVIKLLQHSPLVAVVGMGGLGKTTLTRKVYNKTNGCLRAWVTVSQSYSMVDLLKSIYEQFLKADHKDWSHVDRLRDVWAITEELRSYLTDGKRKRYFVVFDDVWEEKPVIIDFIRTVLPANDKGSRIMMTTRDEGIATSWATNFNGRIYQLKSLPIDEAWLLFCKKTFGNEDCPAQLTVLAKEIVRKCGGLPLVLVAIGGLLSTKNSDYSEWRKVKDTLGSEYGKNSQLESSARILLLSYQELPYYLKPCFLYFGMFPEDFSINRMRLVRLWIAEGFIESHEVKTLEEVALEYVTALVRRNLVQVSRRDVTGRCCSYRVHDVLHEIILSNLKETGFAQVTSKDSSLMNNHFRRLSIHKSFDDSIQHCNTTCNLRTVLVFDNQQMSRFLIGSHLKLLRLLRVLDLQDALIDVIPEELGDLHNLHFLSLRKTKVKTLPKSIGHILNLQTLDLTKSRVSDIPSEAKCLTKMRHLLLSYGDVLAATSTKIAVGVLENFRNLQNLEGVDGSENRSIIIELSNLTQLTNLEIMKLREEDSGDLCRAIDGMEHLRTLCVASASDEVLNIETLTRPPRFLETLKMIGNLKKLPEWIQKLGNLSELVLRGSNLDNDPALMLQGLPNLVQLTLFSAYNGAELNFGLNGYQKLCLINLYGLPNLKSLKGGLPSLRDLTHVLHPNQIQIDVPPHIQPYVKCGDQLLTAKSSSSSRFLYNLSLQLLDNKKIELNVKGTNWLNHTRVRDTHGRRRRKESSLDKPKTGFV